MSVPLNAQRLDVRESKLTKILMILLGVFFVPIGIVFIFNGIQGGKVVPLGLGAALILTFVVIFFLMTRATSKGVKYFSESGIGLAGGGEIAYSELRSVVDTIAMRSATKKGLWRTELRFKDGSAAWLIPNKISNFDEVHAFVRGLPCEQSQEDARG